MELSKPVDWGPVADLRRYVDENFPDLAEQMPSEMSLADSLDVLNSYTGLNIDPDTPLSEGCRTFLARLKEMKQCH